MTPREHIQRLADDERADMSVRHGHYFNSEHEAYAVTCEEVEEARDEFSRACGRMEEWWVAVKGNETEDLYSMKNALISCIQECIQVVSCIDKLSSSREKWNDEV